MSELEDWVIESSDNKGIHLVKQLSLLKGTIKVTIRCTLLSTGKPNVCLRMFSVTPLKPMDADVIASLFSEAIVWYYEEEEGGKVYFWSKSPDKVRFNSLSEVEETIISAIEACLGKKVTEPLTYEKLIDDGWLIYKDDILHARKSMEVGNKLAIIDIAIDRIRTDSMNVDIRIMPTSREEGKRLREKLLTIAKNYKINTKLTSPYFFASLTKRNISYIRDEILILSAYKILEKLVRTE